MTSPEMTLPSVKKFVRDRTHAATRKEPSASTSSSLEGVFDKMTTVQRQIGSPTFDGCEQRKWYNLGNLTGSSQTATHGASGSVCKEYLSTLFSGYTCDKVMVEVFQILPPFICNPDNSRTYVCTSGVKRSLCCWLKSIQVSMHTP